MTDRTEGVARSVHDRLVRHAKGEGLDPTLIFTRYGMERFLYRLGRSEHSDRFVLKGALLLFAWLGELGRATRDVDLLGLGDLSDDTLLSLMQTVCRQPVDDDGMVFDPATIRIGDIRVEDPHGGRRVSLTGRLGAGRIRVQVDVGMGDAFDGEALRAAIEATFDRRQTEVPIRIPPGLTADFASDGRRRQWAAFVTRNDLQAAPDLGAALQTIESFLGPITWMRYEGHSPMAWTPEGGWQAP